MFRRKHHAKLSFATHILFFVSNRFALCARTRAAHHKYCSGPATVSLLHSSCVHHSSVVWHGWCTNLHRCALLISVHSLRFLFHGGKDVNISAVSLLLHENNSGLVMKHARVASRNPPFLLPDVPPSSSTHTTSSPSDTLHSIGQRMVEMNYPNYLAPHTYTQLQLEN